MRKDLRLGGLVGIYLIIKNEQMAIGDEIKKVVMEEIFSAIQDFESQEEVFIMCALEIIGFVGPNERSSVHIGVINGLLCEPTLRRL
jgi:hypothetical protein